MWTHPSPDDAATGSIGIDDVGVLVRSAAAGDGLAWRALVERFSGLVWSVARGYGLGNADAEEVCQTTWLRLAEHIGRLKEPDQAGAWLATTTRHEALKTIRRLARVTPTDDPIVLDRGSDDETPELRLLEAEESAAQLRRSREVWAAFHELSDRCRQLLRMLIATPPVRYEEIASIMGMAVGSIGATRARCLQRLRSNLTESLTP